VASAALDALADRVGQTGVALAAVSNANHLGMIGWYAERYARRGFILLALTTSEALMHPFGGRRALIGTNPIAIGVPGPETPFVFDMATSLVSMGKIHDMALTGEPLQPGWALDADGAPTLDAARAKSGAIAPFGGAKGYALGLAFELLVVGLTGSAIGRDVRGTLDSTELCNKGDVFILIDPAMSTGTAVSIAAYLDEIRASGDPDGNGVRVPGDRSQALRQQRLAEGFSVPDALWEQISGLAAAGRKQGKGRDA
jgi:LDH2 family malate/lactate/ureidoglycolate dehydrogenase